ncbi:MAG: hypothetical protein KIT83_17295, partial [Bryobacterales bacterium]|nr:hypothetical protein [Bryobacterales bacterium]
MTNRILLAALAALLILSGSAASAADANGFEPGKVSLQSSGPLAFGPNGILFAGDSVAATVVAIDTGDTSPAAATSLSVKGINDRIASLLGTTADQILIVDAVVNPISRNVYLSVSRGRGPDAQALILQVAAKDGAISELSLGNARHAKVSLVDAPSADAKDRRGGSLRAESITDLGFVDGRVIVAGLSNEEFASSLRAIPFPFKAGAKGTGIEIYHGAHGRFETNAPVRTFVPYTIANEQHILAAYTCTPLVKIPVANLKPGAKVKGTTIAELGNRNRPLDMISYEKDGSHFILMANSSRGVMKLPTAKLESYPGITEQTEKTGVPYETIATLTGVQHL